MTGTDVVFNAPTTQGGSGGPLLNRNGVMIGVGYAVLSRFGGNSYAVPIRHALPLVAAAPQEAALTPRPAAAYWPRPGPLSRRLSRRDH